MQDSTGNLSQEIYQAMSAADFMQVMSAFAPHQAWLGAVTAVGGHICHAYHITPEGKNRTKTIAMAMFP
jgi:hypothetical protein